MTRARFRQGRVVAALGLIGCVLLVSPVVRAQPPVFHPLEGRVDRCLACHRAGDLGAPGVPPDHVAYANQVCLSCHARPGGSFVQLYAALIPFVLTVAFGVYRTFARFGLTNVLRHLSRRSGTR